MAKLSVLFFPSGSADWLILAEDDFSSKDLLVDRCVKKIRQLDLKSLVRARILIRPYTFPPKKVDEDEPRVAIKQDESVYDLLHREADRFFDIPR